MAPIAKLLPVINPPLVSILMRLIIPRKNEITKLIRPNKRAALKTMLIHTPLCSGNRRELNVSKNGIKYNITPQIEEMIAFIASLLTWTVTGLEESGGFVNVPLQN